MAKRAEGKRQGRLSATRRAPSKKRRASPKKRASPRKVRRVPASEPEARQLFVVHNDKTGQMWVFTKHDDALRCRQEQRLDQSHLWGCAVDCYLFKDEAA